jgi:general secretion pathway protein K
VIARGSERGMALVVALIFTTAMAAAAVAFLAGRQSDALSLRGQLQAVEAQAMLDAALQQTAAVLVNRTERQMIPPELHWQFGNVAVSVHLESEAGKVDLNKSDDSMLRGLLLALDLKEDLATTLSDVIMDWRDDNHLKRAAGAEDRDYRSGSSPASGAADRPFASTAELRYLPTVSPAIWALLAPLVTVYSGVEEPEARQAPEQVRRALGIARGLAKSTPGKDDNGAENGTGTTRDATAGENASGGLKGSAAQAGTLSRVDATQQRTGGIGSDEERRGMSGSNAGAADSGPAGGEGAEDASRPRTVLLDVRFPNGYEAAAKAVIALSVDGGGEQPFIVLSWTPILRERGDRS